MRVYYRSTMALKDVLVDNKNRIVSPDHLSETIMLSGQPMAVVVCVVQSNNIWEWHIKALPDNSSLTTHLGMISETETWHLPIYEQVGRYQRRVGWDQFSGMPSETSRLGAGHELGAFTFGRLDLRDNPLPVLVDFGDFTQALCTANDLTPVSILFNAALDAHCGQMEGLIPVEVKPGNLAVTSRQNHLERLLAGLVGEHSGWIAVNEGGLGLVKSP